MIASRRRKTVREPTVALINIVFLILIFFMVSGTLAPTPESGIDFVSSEDLECCAPGDVLTISVKAELAYNGTPYRTVQHYLASNPPGIEPLRILPDRKLPAETLLQTIQRLRVAGAKRILLVIEHGR